MRSNEFFSNFNFMAFIEPVNNCRITSPIRSSTPLFNGNGNTRPTSPASSSPLRHTIAGANPSVNNLRSREGSREREREPLDYTDLEGNHSSRMKESFHRHFFFRFSYSKSSIGE